MPIEEMLDDLRLALERFETNPCDETFAPIQRETMRIECFCEDMLGEDE